mmetsp:Transcript_1081/g.2520  ORF Transcript_1081/g.2520 Transcript_1081/m.2520 type:complete len:93 (-) Transcript_1081:48-326(-)
MLRMPEYPLVTTICFLAFPAEEPEQEFSSTTAANKTSSIAAPDAAAPSCLCILVGRERTFPLEYASLVIERKINAVLRNDLFCHHFNINHCQ